jgi:hypothetical protein
MSWWIALLTVPLGLGAIYLVVRGTYDLVRPVRLRNSAANPEVAQGQLKVKLYQFAFTVICAAVIVFILLMIWGVPRILIHTSDSLYQLP